jgi:DNA-binding NtrC family response regulator
MVPEPAPAPVGGMSTLNIDAGLPALRDQHERAILEEALRRFPRLTRKELATKLKIGTAVLFKKLRKHGLGG